MTVGGREIIVWQNVYLAVVEELDQFDYRFFDVYCGSEKSGWYLQRYFVSVISQFIEYVLW